MLTVGDPETFWIVFANLVLGVAVMACLLVVVFGIVYGAAARVIRRHRQWSEMDREVKLLFAELEHRAA